MQHIGQNKFNEVKISEITIDISRSLFFIILMHNEKKKKKAHGTISNWHQKFKSLFMSVALDSGDVEVLLQPAERFIFVDEECKIWMIRSFVLDLFKSIRNANEETCSKSFSVWLCSMRSWKIFLEISADVKTSENISWDSKGRIVMCELPTWRWTTKFLRCSKI